MMKERQHKRIRRALHSPQQGKGDSQREIGEVVANVSPRDITNFSFGRETSKDKDVDRINTSTSQKTIVERNEAFGTGEDKENISPSDVFTNVNQHMEVVEKCNENIQDSFNAKKVKASFKQQARSKSRHSDGTAKICQPKGRVAENEKLCAETHNGTANARRKAVEVPQQIEETATSSSSSFTKRASRPRRTSIAYLQQTRPHRRAVAKARTERLKREREEEYEQEQIRKLDGMAQEEREIAIQSLESERREREAARRREVKRVKNRESVEKSRVRELVFEAKVGCEWDDLRKENECMAQVAEWFKASNIMKEARKEVNGVVRKRKRRKLM